MRRIACMVVVDHAKGAIVVDGVEVLPDRFIAADPQVEVEENGIISQVQIGIWADNVLIIGRDGGKPASPSARELARATVRRGLADVLEWLGETP